MSYCLVCESPVTTEQWLDAAYQCLIDGWALKKDLVNQLCGTHATEYSALLIKAESMKEVRERVNELF